MVVVVVMRGFVIYVFIYAINAEKIRKQHDGLVSEPYPWFLSPCMVFNALS